MSAAAVIPQLNPFVVYDPFKKCPTHEKWSKVWTVATVVSAVAFIALATSAFIAAMVYWPTQFPLVGILIFAAGMPASAEALKHLWNKATFYSKEASIDRAIMAKMIPSDALPSKLSDIGLPPVSLDIPQTQHLLARYEYYRDQEKTCLEQGQKILGPGPLEFYVGDTSVTVTPSKYTIDQVDFTKITDVGLLKALQRKRKQGENLLTQAATFKLKAAYMLQIMQAPYEARQMVQAMQAPHEARQRPGFFELVTLSWRKRLVAKEHGDAGFDILIKTPKNSFTRQAILDAEITTLAKEVYGTQFQRKKVLGIF